MTDFPDRRPISEVPKEEFDKIWTVYAWCGETEAGFNGQQLSYRQLASAWLLATLGAIGFLLFELEPPKVGDIRAVIDSYLIAAGIGFVSATGIGVIWVLDLWVCHRLLNAVFFVGIRLEDRYRWLPPARHAMMLMQEGVGVEPKTAVFYIGTAGLPLCLGIGFLVLSLSEGQLPAGTLAVAFPVLFVAMWLTARLMRRHSSDAKVAINQLDERVEALRDLGFKDKAGAAPTN